MLLIDSIHWGFRMLSRICDYCLFYLVIGGIALSLPYFYMPFFYCSLALATPFLWLFLEAFFLSRWATTPGKFLFGLSVYQAEGFKLSYKQALGWALCLPKRRGILHQRGVSFKRKAVAVIASAVIGFSALYGNALALWSAGLDEKQGVVGWVQYSSDQAGFKISFPKDPQEISQELIIPDGKTLPYEEVKSQESRKVAYSVSYLDLPKKWRIAGNTTLLKGVLDLIVKHSPEATLIEKEFGVHGKYRVLDYKMIQGKEEIQGRLIITGSATLYKITVTYPIEQPDHAKIFAFLDSFEVVN